MKKEILPTGQVEKFVDKRTMYLMKDCGVEVSDRLSFIRLRESRSRVMRTCGKTVLKGGDNGPF